jgi:hypothetical protein
MRDAVNRPDDPTYLVHFLAGLGASVGALLVHCLIFTYLLGTGRWVKEVKLAYDLSDDPLPRETRELKRKTFPVALAAMLITIAAAAAGAGVQVHVWPWQAHATLATAALLANLVAFVVEFRTVRRNGEIIDEVLREVDRVRREHGLPSNAEAIRDA